MKNIAFLLAFVFVISCEKKKEENGTVKEIDLSQAYSRDDKVLLSEIADSISYVKIQSDSSCFIGNIRKPYKNIQFAQDRFFINDGNELFAFENSGKFLFKIGRQGKGPNEYFRIDNFTILSKQRLVFIYSAAQRKLMIYTFENKLIDSISINFWPLQLSVLQDEYIVFGSGKGRRELTDYYTISILNRDGQTINRLIYRDWEEKIEKEDKLGLCNMAQLYNYCDTLSYWEYQYNKIWRIPDEHTAYPEYYINLGSEKFPIEYILESAGEKRRESNNFAHLWRFTETNRYFFFRVGYKKHLKHILYDKKTGKLSNVHHKDNGHRFQFVNNIDGGMTFWPDGLIFKNKVFSIVYGYEVYREMLKKDNDIEQPKAYNKLRDMVSKTNIMDNPMLMIVHLKN